MAIKVAFIGAGSLTFTRGLFRDILTVPALQDTQFALMDINKQYLDMTAELCWKDIRANKLPATITATTSRRQALEGADYVVSSVRIGGLDGFKTDIDIPLKYGVDQCVGDTLCAGGIMYGQRNVAFVLDLCRDIREVASRKALLLNYANPNAMNTWAANHVGKVNTIGLCHGVMGGHWQITEVIKLLVNGARKPGDRGYVNVTSKDVDIICAGINHQTWYVQILYKGKDWTGRMLEGFEKHPVYSKTEKVRIDMLRRFGYYSTESNGHLSEYVAWYRKRPAEITRWIDLSSWINGETGGYLRVCTEGRNWFIKAYRQTLKEAGSPLLPEKRGHEHGSYIIEGLETGNPYRGHFNVVNNGCITNLPGDAIIEVPGYVDRNGVSIPRVGPLPMGCAAVCNASISVQRLAVQAAVEGDVELLRQALMMDPLTGAVCDTEQIEQMADEMLVAQAQWLPQYRREIPKAKARLAAARRQGRYRGISRSKGAARLEIRTSPRKADDWARKEKAKILAAFKVTALQPPARDIRKVSMPPAAAFATSMRSAPAASNAGFLDIRRVHDGKDGLVFMKTVVKAPRAGAGAVVYGSDGPVVVFVNGRAIDAQPTATNPCVPGQYKAAARWKKGDNDLVFALSSNRGNAWGIYAAARY